MEKEATKGFLDYFSDLKDHRLDRKKFYRMDEILLIAILSVICGAEGWEDMELFGQTKLEYLRKFLPFKNGTPSDDTFRRFFRRLEPKEFQTRFYQWMRSLSLSLKTLISIDGKVSCHTFDGDEKAAIHTVSAFASEMHLVLAQTTVDEKSNEITAIPTLLAWLDLKGAIVTIDAMGCQEAIARQIREAEGDYILSLKGNQNTLHQDVRDVFSDPDLLKELDAEVYKNVDAGHGRIETRIYRVVEIPTTLQQTHSRWKNLKTLVEAESLREWKGKTKQEKESEKRYYISSLSKDPLQISKAIRSHWAIENSLHYVLDVTFREDDSRIRKENTPENIAVIRHAAFNLLKQSQKKRQSIKQLRKLAGWNHNKLYEIFSKIL